MLTNAKRRCACRGWMRSTLIGKAATVRAFDREPEGRIQQARQDRRARSLDVAVRRVLLRRELAIAKKYYHLGQRQTWPYVVLAVLGIPLWLALLPLAMLHLIPVGVAGFIAVLLVPAIWVAGHEAMHSTIGREGSPRRGWNEAVGKLAMLPMLYPFSIARIIHLQHHRHCNDPVHDPDYHAAAASYPLAIRKFWLSRQRGPDAYMHQVRRVVCDHVSPAEAQHMLRTTAMMQVAGYLFFIALALQGYAIEIALIWWLPRWAALFFIQVGLGWDPHHPHGGTGRYDSTRIFRSRFGCVSMGIEGHLAHHLYPTIPMHLTKRALAEMRPLLEQRGVDFTDF